MHPVFGNIVIYCVNNILIFCDFVFIFFRLDELLLEFKNDQAAKDLAAKNYVPTYSVYFQNYKILLSIFNLSSIFILARNMFNKHCFVIVTFI